jgi:phage terminase large subunit-like protein
VTLRTIDRPPADIAGYDPLLSAEGYEWDGVEAARAVDFFADMLTHPDDSPTAKAGSPFVLQPWQADYIATLFGWRSKADRSRRYRESLAGLPRKNGKSTLASGIMLYSMLAEGRQGAQIYSAAQTRDQAGLIFAMAARMVRQSPKLSKRLKIIDSTKRITYQKAGSFYRAIPADAGPVHGTKPATVIFDELHTQARRDLYDALKTGQGSTVNPLFVNITTAGFNRHSICWEVWQYARQVRDGVMPDPTFLPMLYELKDGQAWDSPETWRECNPNFGVSISADFLRQEYERAKVSTAYENTFRNLYLNQWTEQAVRWIPMERWDDCDEALPDLTGQPCYAGLDLSATEDITALALVFPLDDGTFAVLPKFWIPEETAARKERQDAVPYRKWIAEGLVTATPGDCVDHSVVRADINRLAQQYTIREIAYDRALSIGIAPQLAQEDGFPMEPFGQGWLSMSEPSKTLFRLVMKRQLVHGGNPVLRWMAANVSVARDAADNIKPVKDKSTGRIDGIVATIMGLGRATALAGQQWYYATNGVEIG